MELANKLFNLLLTYSEVIINFVINMASPYKLEIIMGLLVATFFFGLIQGFK